MGNAVTGTMDEQLKTLFDYTKFHIGMYTALIAGIVGIFSVDSTKTLFLSMIPFLCVSAFLFLLSGMAAGLIASSSPYYKTFDAFMNAKIGPWNKTIFTARTCTHIEHLLFWLGCTSAVGGFMYVMWRHDLILKG